MGEKLPLDEELLSLEDIFSCGVVDGDFFSF